MATMIKTVKQYSEEISQGDLDELLFIGKHYRNAKNYIFSRYSGISSLPLITSERKIRDEWVKTLFYGQWKLPARYWKLALTETFGQIKAQWTHIKNKVKQKSFRNPNLNDDDKHYINYMLKSNILYHKILVKEKFELPSKLKNKIPYTFKPTFSIDTGLYRYKDDAIKITCAKKGKRVSIKLRDNNVYDRTMTVKFNGNKIEIHCPLKVKAKKNNNENIVGIDKGYNNLLATSTNHFYGEKLNEFLTKETERLNKVNQNRNRFYALYKKYIKDENFKKAEKIRKNNLGKIRYNKNKKKHEAKIKSYINYSLNQFLKEEKPKEIVMENLDFVNWDNTYPKHIKRRISRWIKGYIRSRLEYKSDLNQIIYTYINPAYTSKICSICGKFGVRSFEVFECSNCGKAHADINASKNILNRKNDKEINLYTPYRKVKKILENRIL